MSQEESVEAEDVLAAASPRPVMIRVHSEPNSPILHPKLLQEKSYSSDVLQVSSASPKPKPKRSSPLGPHLFEWGGSTCESSLSDDSCSSTPEPPKRSFRDAARKVCNIYRVFRRKKYPWIQLAGHAEGFKQPDPSSGWILKKGSHYEKLALEEVQADPLKDFCAEFHGVTMVEDREFLQLKNLLVGFENPCIMDCKIGIRTFLESETDNHERRRDLLKKMIEIDPSAPTEDEKHHGVTKFRYMQFRESESSTAALGFRIEALKLAGVPEMNLKQVKSRKDVVRVMGKYFEGHPVVIESVLTRLAAFRAALSTSHFFKSHEVIGSSLLFVYDSFNQSGVWMIDFGKTVSVDKKSLQHDVPWVPGNREDGYLLGLDNLISVIEEIQSLMLSSSD